MSPENGLDYILLRVNGAPGQDFVGNIQRGWLQPLKHSFLEGEPLFIIQHPNGGPLAFAFDRVKGCEEARVTYWTNTEHGSSGSPCFTFAWDLVALHQRVTHPKTDPDRPNMGIPFSRILEQPRIQAMLAG